MRRRKTLRELITGSLVAMIVLTGCQTITSPIGMRRPDYTALPEETMRDIAYEIEQIVAEGRRDFTIQDRESIVVNTEEVLHAIRTRAARSELIDEFRDTGHAWERRDGHLWIIRSREYRDAGTRRDRDRNALMISGESENRWTIYEGIRKASNLRPAALPAIQEIFFEVRLEFMSPGQKYETEAGEVGIMGG